MRRGGGGMLRYFRVAERREAAAAFRVAPPMLRSAAAGISASAGVRRCVRACALRVSATGGEGRRTCLRLTWNSREEWLYGDR